MCSLCQSDAADLAFAKRREALRLLSLLETSDALSPEAALRISERILSLSGSSFSGCICEEVFEPDPVGESRNSEVSP